jgi:hypothetical protein
VDLRRAGPELRVAGPGPGGEEDRRVEAAPDEVGDVLACGRREGRLAERLAMGPRGCPDEEQERDGVASGQGVASDETLSAG